jgi:uncharacterized protein (DUF2147 family)
MARAALIWLGVAALGAWLAGPAWAADARLPTGLWLTEDRGGIVRVEPCGGALCGVIVGLSDFPPSGVKLDVHGRSQCHLTLLAGLRLQDDGRWHGTVTNPEDGRTYSAEVWVPADGILRLRGYVGLPLFGSTQLWPPYTGRLRDDCHFP